MVYTISIFEDKTIKCDKNIHINYKENEIDEILFDLPTFLNDFTKICVLYTPNRKKIELPINDNKIIVSSDITTRFGDWKLCLVATNGEKIFISDELLFKVDKTYIDSSVAEEIDANLELLILELENTLSKLDDTKIEEIGSVVEELKEIKEAISNINVDVDFSVVLDEIDTLEDNILILQNKIDNISIEVDFTQVLSVLNNISNDINTFSDNTKNTLSDISTQIANIPDYTSTLSEIKDLISNIDVDVDLTPVLNAIDLIDGTLQIVDNKIDLIPNYTDDLSEIKNGETTIKSMIQSLIASQSGQFSQVLSNTNNIPSMIISLNQIKSILDTIPTNDYTSELQSIKDILDTIPTNDYTNDINTIVHELTDVGIQGTIANNTKWSLTRAEEAKSISQQCYQLLTDVSLQLDEI